MWIWIIAISALILAAAATVCSAFYFFRFAIARPESPADPNEIENPAYDGSRWHQAARKGLALMRTLPREEITRTSRDGLRLHATFFPAEQPSSRTVLAIHGYKSCGLKEYSLFLEFYRSMGFNLLLPDNRAHGQSEGKYIGFGNPDRFDCVMWAEYLADRFGKDSFILLHGVSMGAATVLSASGESLPPQVKGIVSDCSYTSAWDEFKNEMQRTFHLPPFPILPLCEGICKLRAGYGFRKNSPLSQAGDMPDVMFWDCNYNDYVKYTEQGVLKALPDDYAERYPNLAAALHKTGVEDTLKKANDGKLYVIPNVTYQNLPTELPIDSTVAIYRKDWAKELGFEVGETITMDRLCELANLMIEEDPAPLFVRSTTTSIRFTKTTASTFTVLSNRQRWMV